MKNCIKIIGIIVFIAVIGFSLVACNKQTQDQTSNQSQSTNPFLGTWIDSGTKSKILFIDKKWIFTLNTEIPRDSIEGTYTFKNDNAILKFSYFADEFEYSANINGNTMILKMEEQTFNLKKQ